MLEFLVTVSAGHEHATMPADVSYLCPMSSWWALKCREEKKARLRGYPRTYPLKQPKLPGSAKRAADSGGFVAMTTWGGEYPYTAEEYIEWLGVLKPCWAATMDFCCEESIAKNPTEVRSRQDKTTAMARKFFEEYWYCKWAWVPTIQGWEIEDYRRHAIEMRPLIYEMAEYYKDNPEWRVGIGTLCNRADGKMVRAVAAVVAAELPGIPLHLWGVKVDALKGSEAIPSAVISTDSAAWNGMFADGIEEWRETGLTRREHDFRLALPDYTEKYEEAQRGVKQIALLL